MRVVPKTTERYNYPTRAPYRPTQPPPRCYSNEFQCDNGECVPMSSRCNNRVDCRDRSDELSCRKFYVFFFYYVLLHLSIERSLLLKSTLLMFGVLNVLCQNYHQVFTKFLILNYFFRNGFIKLNLILWIHFLVYKSFCCIVHIIVIFVHHIFINIFLISLGVWAFN